MVSLYNFLNKNGMMVALGIGVLIIVAHFVGIAGGIESFNEIPQNDPESKPQLLEEGSAMVSTGVNLTVALLVLAFIVLVVFGIWQVVTNPKGAVKGIAGLAVILIIFFIGWSMSEGEVLPVWDEKGFNITPTISKYVSGGVFASVAIIAVAFIGLILSEIRNFFK